MATVQRAWTVTRQAWFQWPQQAALLVCTFWDSFSDRQEHFLYNLSPLIAFTNNGIYHKGRVPVKISFQQHIVGVPPMLHGTACWPVLRKDCGYLDSCSCKSCMQCGLWLRTVKRPGGLGECHCPDSLHSQSERKEYQLYTPSMPFSLPASVHTSLQHTYIPVVSLQIQLVIKTVTHHLHSRLCYAHIW